MIDGFFAIQIICGNNDDGDDDIKKLSKIF